MLRTDSKIRAALALTVVLALLVPASAFAHTLTLAQARSAASAQAQKIKRETGASSSRVTNCARKTGHKVLCKVKSSYSNGGLSSCVTDVTVYYTSHAAKRPRTAVGQSACS